jgi:hypothetical protein
MPKQTTTQKRKRVTNKGGQCLNNEAAMNLLEAEAAKRQKLIDSEIKKRDREETRKKEQEEKEQNRVLKRLKKANLNRKECDCGLKYEEEIKCNKSRWLSCFKCGIWCCFDCLPESFHVNKILNLYFCGSFSKNNEN